MAKKTEASAARKTTSRSTASKSDRTSTRAGQGNSNGSAKPRSPRSNGRSRKAAPNGGMIHLDREQVAARAYLIWEANGRPSGQEEQNWCEAERQLRAENA